MLYLYVLKFRNINHNQYRFRYNEFYFQVDKLFSTFNIKYAQLILKKSSNFNWNFFKQGFYYFNRYFGFTSFRSIWL